MLILSHLLLKWAAGFYGLSLFTELGFNRRSPVRWILILCAIVVNAAAVALRYKHAWPMLPMYLGPVALPLALGILSLITARIETQITVRRILLALALVTALAAIFFPKDFYLPFPKSFDLSAHLFFLFGMAGRACYLVSAAWALNSLRSEEKSNDYRGNPNSNPTLRWAVWGFAFWTFSMFAGELWSYRGWGTPVVWEDPAITSVMATWFFYVCLLHLHLIGAWRSRGRNIYAAAGAIVVLVLNYLPELGPFRWLI